MDREDSGIAGQGWLATALAPTVRVRQSTMACGRVHTGKDAYLKAAKKQKEVVGLGSHVPPRPH